MRISLQHLSNVGVIKGIVRLSKNDDFKVFESILQIGRLAGRSGVYRLFHTKSSKMTL